jgi:ubiquinone biosynthesis protein
MLKLPIPPQLARDAGRFRDVAGILLKYGLADWLHHFDVGVPERISHLFQGPDGSRLYELSQAERIRLAITDLGTTAIKIGQILSTRADLVGPDIAEELRKLQADVPADPPEAVRHAVLEAFGKHAEDLFAEFDDVALASASIGQVHRAKLFDGRDVVVKIQHPNISQKIETDFRILIQLAEWAEAYDSNLKLVKPKALMTEMRRVMRKELNFLREALNLERFIGHFKDDPKVRFPGPISELCTDKILTMEFIEGIPVREIEQIKSLGISDADLAERGANVFLKMIFQDGFYHADPHPGNILVNAQGQIILLDGGMVGVLDETSRNNVETMLEAVVEQDNRLLEDVIRRIGSTPEDLDRLALRQDLAEFISDYVDVPIRLLNISAVLTNVTAIVRKHHIVLSPPYAMLIKVLVMLEGTSRLLNPRFNLAELLMPYYQNSVLRKFNFKGQLLYARRLMVDFSQLVRDLPNNVSTLLEQLESGKLSIRLEHRRIESAVNRLVQGLLCTALFMGSSMLWSSKTPPTIYGTSVPGSIGCLIGVMMGVRLLRAIQHTGGVEHKGS